MKTKNESDGRERSEGRARLRDEHRARTMGIIRSFGDGEASPFGRVNDIVARHAETFRVDPFRTYGRRGRRGRDTETN